MKQRPLFFSVFTALFFISFLFTSTSLLFAQDQSREGRAEQAGVIAEQVLEEVEEALRVPAGQPPAAEKEEGPEAVTQPQVRFTVKEIDIVGNTIISDKEAAVWTEPFKNKEITIEQLKRIAQVIEDEYRRRGYLTTRIIIPPQKIIGGEVKLQAVEGKVGNLIVQDNKFFSKQLILSYSVIHPGDFLHSDDLIKTLKRMNSNPDRTVRAVIKRGEQPGTSDLLFKVEDRLPLHAGFSFDNLGNQSTGVKRFGFTARHNNLLGHDDVLYTGTVFGEEFGVYYAQYAYPIIPWDMRFVGGFSYSQVSPKRDLAIFGVNGVSQTYFGRMEKKIIQTQQFNLSVFSVLDFKDSRTKVQAGTFRRDRLRVIRAGPEINYVDPLKGLNTLGQDFSFGTKLFGGQTFLTPTATNRLDTAPEFFKMTGTYRRDQKMPFSTALKVEFSYQYASMQLPIAETFYLGGMNSVRGYPEGDYLADLGLHWTAEYLVPAFFIPKDFYIPTSKTPLWELIQFVAFWDQAYGEMQTASLAENDRQSMYSVGTGIRARVWDKLYARVEWAWALGNLALTEAPEDRMKFYFRLTYEI